MVFCLVSLGVSINILLSISRDREMGAFITVCLSNKSNMPQAMKSDTYLEMKHNLDGKNAITLRSTMSI